MMCDLVVSFQLKKSFVRIENVVDLEVASVRGPLLAATKQIHKLNNFRKMTMQMKEEEDELSRID